jgi:hypothetical protein
VRTFHGGCLSPHPKGLFGGPLRLHRVKIPGGGDLAPPRRRRYGGSYGRRRHRRNLRVGVALLLVAVGVGAAYLLRHDDGTVKDRLATTTPTPKACVTTSSPAAAAAASVMALPKPQQVRLALLNGTSRNGLAKTVGDQLAALGFVVTAQANAPAALNGASTVTFGTGAQPAGTLVSHWVLGARLIGNPKVPRGTVQVVLGSAFQRLATPAEAAAAAAPSPAASSAPVASPTGCPS